jgi:hypothetical protein
MLKSRYSTAQAMTWFVFDECDKGIDKGLETTAVESLARNGMAAAELERQRER